MTCEKEQVFFLFFFFSFFFGVQPLYSIVERRCRRHKLHDKKNNEIDSIGTGVTVTSVS